MYEPNPQFAHIWQHLLATCCAEIKEVHVWGEWGDGGGGGGGGEGDSGAGTMMRLRVAR